MRWLALLVVMISTPAAAQVVPPGEVARNAVEQFIRPGFAEFAAQTGQLAKDMGFLCARPAEDLRAAARAQFRLVVTRWGHIEWLKIGPLVVENRSERILFFPDRKGIALRQVQALLAEEDETATSPETLRDKSVALQGLGALEFVLFGTGSETLATTDGDYRCRYGLAVAQAIAGVAADMRNEWADPDGVSTQLLAPSPDDPLYRSVREVLEELTGQMVFGIEAVRDQRLLPVVGRDRFVPKPRSALFWRSGLTMAVIRANFESIGELYARSRMGAAGEGDSTWLEQSVAYAFATTDAILERIHDPIADALEDEAQVHALDALITQTSTLQTLVGANTAAVLDLSVGFSSLDGD